MNENITDKLDEREKLLYLWKRKYDALEMDIQENERKLKYARERQHILKQDIISQLIIALVCGVVVGFLFYMEEYIFWYFKVTYYLGIRGVTILAVLYNGIQIIKAIKNYIYHTKTVEDWKKPGARISNMKTGLEPESSCQLEIQKILWILEQYDKEREIMQELRSKIELGKIATIEELEQQLNQIIIYEIIRNAKIKRGWKH